MYCGLYLVITNVIVTQVSCMQSYTKQTCLTFSHSLTSDTIKFLIFIDYVTRYTRDQSANGHYWLTPAPSFFNPGLHFLANNWRAIDNTP